MYIGPKLVVIGAISGAVFLSLSLYTLAAGLSYDAALAGMNSIENAVTSPNQDEHSAQTAGSGCEVSSQFPESVLRWCDQITHHAKENSLSPDLVAALILQESGGNALAYSRSGAVGLMQVMPRDGLAASFMCKNGPCFHDRPTITQLQDPAFNVAYGTRLLARLVKRNGNLREALKSYGPMDVGYYYADKVLSLYQRYGN